MVTAGRQLSHQSYLRLKRESEVEKNAGVKYTALGGQFGVGGPNSGLFTAPNGQQLMIDCGKTVSDSGTESMNSYPDISFVDLPKLSAVVLTHGHNDHISALPYLAKIRGIRKNPLIVAGTRTTLVYVRRAFLTDGYFDGENISDYVDLKTIGVNQTVGKFQIESHEVPHSIPETVAYVITVAGKTMLYTTDLKYMNDSWQQLIATRQWLTEVSLRDIDVHFLDSSYADANIAGYTPSMTLMENELARLFSSERYCERRFIITMFSSNIMAMKQVVEIANAAGRPVKVLGRSMKFSAEEFGIVDPETQKGLVGNVVFIVTGSQAEEYSVLNQASGEESSLVLDKMDVVVQATSTVPSNIRRVNEMFGRIRQFGCEVITPQTNPAFHISGHPMPEEATDMASDVYAKLVVPIHAGEKGRSKMCDRVKAIGLKTKMVGDGESFII